MMLIGVLETDNLSEDLKQNFGTYPQMLQRWLVAACPNLTFRVYQAIEGELPLHFDECNAYVITGSKHGVYDDLPWIKAIMDWVRAAYEAQVKLTGICFGHQLIAHALGGRTEKSRKGWGVGVHSYEVVCDKSVAELDLTQLKFLVSHQDQVVCLPPGATRTLSNSFCENAGFRMGENILTFQGHPEFQQDYIRHLMQTRRERLGESCFQRALASLDQPTDADVIAHWLLGVLHPVSAG